MEIQVTLHGIMRDYLPRQAKGKTTLQLPDGATIEDALQALKIERTINGAVNGEQVEVTHQLHEGDELQIFRPIGGG